MIKRNNTGPARSWRFAAGLLGAFALSMILVACTAGAGSSTAQSSPAAGPRLSFKEPEHDFGQFSHSQKIEYHFAFTNTGNAPLQVGEITLAPIDPASCA